MRKRTLNGKRIWRGKGDIKQNWEILGLSEMENRSFSEVFVFVLKGGQSSELQIRGSTSLTAKFRLRLRLTAA